MSEKRKQYKTRWQDGVCIQWVADRHARRVPLFVIQATGLKTKLAVEEKYGTGVTFALTDSGKGYILQQGVKEE